MNAPRSSASLFADRSAQDAEQSLEELAGLADAAGADVVLRMIQERPTPDSSTFIGRGKLDELAAECARFAVDVVIFDNELTPAQLRQIEERVDRKVIDRTQLILDIFARRARTREGKWQVELAQLKYMLPRLVGSGTALSRLGGGIGTRGPGETKLETDRRRIRQKIHAISQEIDSIRQRRQHSRARRQKASVPLVALVGYTNAGKIDAVQPAHERLAPKRRTRCSSRSIRWCGRCSLPDKRQLLMSDTVGFIDRLPHTLVAAFRATLEQVAEADLVLHVIDAASPERDRHVEAVRRVLEEVGAANVATLDVFNKCDLIEPAEAERLRAVASGSAVYFCPEGQAWDGPPADDRRHCREARTGYAPRDARVRLGERRRPRDDRPCVPACASVESRDQRRAGGDRGRCAAPRARSRQSRRCPMRSAGVQPCRCCWRAGACSRGCSRAVAPPVVTAPRYPAYIFPTLSPPDPTQADFLRRHEGAWRWFQAGDLARAESEFQAVLKRAPLFYPSDVALGYVHLARNNYAPALERFDRVLQTRGQYVPALVGRGEALLAQSRDADALAAFESAVKLDPTLVEIGRRVEVLRARAAQETVAAARRAAQANRLDEAAGLYEKAIAASPDSAFLVRDLADVEAKLGKTDQALARYRRAIELDPVGRDVESAHR